MVVDQRISLDSSENAASRRQQMERRKKELYKNRNASFRTNRPPRMSTINQPDIPMPTEEDRVPHVAQGGRRSNSRRKRSRTTSFIRSWAVSSSQPKSKGARFLDVAAEAEVPIEESRPFAGSPLTPRQSIDPEDENERRDGRNLPDVSDRFVNVARVQDERELTGRYADSLSNLPREPAPPPFRRPRRSTIGTIKRALGLN